ncbi:MAG: hypothetical protein IRZ16_05015 [Myxococcaceae bacterium]|nr:hypothetical protein [Myxococcaceae bacterium]
MVVSIGWFGAAASVLALSIVALARPGGAGTMYEATEVVWRAAIVPSSLSALLTGVVQALATQWGLFRYLWVATKLVITVAAVLLLLLHTQSMLSELVRSAIDGQVQGYGGMSPRVHLVVASGGTLVLLFVTTILSIFKPWGRTGLGRA